MLSRRIPAGPAPNAWSLALESARASGRPLLDLTESNPTRAGLSPRDEDLFAALAGPGARRYDPDPRGGLAARAAVAAELSREGREVPPEDVLLTSGTSESYQLLFKLLANPGERVATPAPSYPLFEPLARAEGLAVEPWRLAWTGRWEMDPGSVDRALAAGARALVVVQPNHPTGSCLATAELAALEARCASHGAALVSDEVFGGFPWPPAEGPLPGLLDAGREVPTFVLGGLSKSCGLPQVKVGWIVLGGPAPARDVARRGLEWLADLTLTVGGPAQAALPRLLAAGPAFRARVRARLADNLGALRALCARRPEIGLREAEGGWSAILRLPLARSGEDWAIALLGRGVIAHPGHFYDLEGEAFLVSSLIPEPAAFAEGLARIEDLVAAG